MKFSDTYRRFPPLKVIWEQQGPSSEVRWPCQQRTRRAETPIGVGRLWQRWRVEHDHDLNVWGHRSLPQTLSRMLSQNTASSRINKFIPSCSPKTGWLSVGGKQWVSSVWSLRLLMNYPGCNSDLGTESSKVLLPGDLRWFRNKAFNNKLFSLKPLTKSYQVSQLKWNAT